MARREWTLLVMSDDQTQVRQVKITRELIRTVIGAALVLASLVLSVAGAYFVRGGEEGRVARLQQRNDLLKAEVLGIREQVTALETALGDLTRKDEHYRLLAGLDPLDEDVLQAGIGGPGGAMREASALWTASRGADRLALETSGELSTLVRRARLLSSSWDEAARTLSAKHAELEATPSILPTRGVLTSGFSYSRRHPILNRSRPHEGIDITAPTGTPILAAAKGRVVKSGRDGAYGLMVEIDHGFGYVTRYAHASRLHAKVGQTVERGDVIGLVGSTGLSVGPHLHYEVLVNGKPVNPRRFIFDTGAIQD